jgi:RNA polymerase sigma-70 factor (sigma-E family)
VTTDSQDVDFSAFVLAHRTRLVQAALLMTGGRFAEAEDLVQVALMRLYAKWSRVRRVEAPLSYAQRTLTNVFLDEAKRAHRRREVATARHQDTSLPRDDAEIQSMQSAVMDALGALAPRQRAVVVLRHFLGYDVAGTARLLGIAEGTVKSQNAKALAHLRELLGSDIEYEELPQ